MIKFNFSFKTIVLALVGMVCLGVTNAEAATVATVYGGGGSSTNHTTFADAWADAVSRDNSISNITIQLKTSPVTVSSTCEFSSSATATAITLNLSGCKLQNSGSFTPLLKVNKAGATLIIESSSNGGQIYTTGARAVQVNAGTLQLQSGKLHVYRNWANASGYAICVDGTASDKAKAIINGGEVLSEADGYTYGVYAVGANASATIKGGTITAKSVSNNSANGTYYFGICTQTNATITVDAGDTPPMIKAENAPAEQAFAVNGGNNVTLNGGRFRSVGSNLFRPNTPQITGGVIYVDRAITAPAGYVREELTSSEQSSLSMPSGSYAIRKQATVSFNQNGGTGGQTSSVTATYGKAMPTPITKPTRTNYVFGGYGSNSNGTNLYYDANGASNKTWDKLSATTLNAWWKSIVTLNPQIAKSGYEGTTSVTTWDGETFNNITAPKNDYYTFHGYWTGEGGAGTQLITAQTVGGSTIYPWITNVAGWTGEKNGKATWIHDGSATIYAKWTQTATLNPNGGSGGSGNVTMTYKSSTHTAITNPTRTGYNFAGWYTASSGGSMVMNTSGVLQANVLNWTDASSRWIKVGSTQIYARWTANTYTVHFNGNGNTGGSTADQGFTYGTAQNLRANGFTKTGYVFAGWAKSASGAVVYSNSQSVNNLTTTNGATVNLYAKWAKVVATVTVNGTTTQYADFQTAFNYAKTQAGAVLQLQDHVTYSADEYIKYDPSTAIANTLDLNGYTLTGGNSGNRLLNLSRGTYTIKDSRTGGKLSFSKSGALYCVVVNAGTTLNLQSGTVYCENTGGWVRAIYTDNGTINISGSGTVDAKATTEATAVYANTCSSSGTGANISGNAVISASPTSTYANGGRLYVIRTVNSPVTVTGGTVNAKVKDMNAYCFRVDGASSNLTISGGTFNIDSDDRTQGYNFGIITYEGTTTISGGTFKNYCTGSNCAGIRALAGTVTIEETNHPFFDSQKGIFAGDAAPASDVISHAIVNINGGTFKCTHIAVDANQNPQPAEWASASTKVYSTITINGGKFSSTLNTPLVRKTGNSNLTLNGGYYDEYSTTTNHYSDINPYKGSGKEVVSLDADDAMYTAGYRYIITSTPVAKVSCGSERTYHATLTDAFTQANAKTADVTIQVLQPCTVTSTLTFAPTNAINGTLDLNGKTLSSTNLTILTVDKAGTTFTIKDSQTNGTMSVSRTGAWDATVKVANGKVVVQSGTISCTSTTGAAVSIGVEPSGSSNAELEVTGGKVQGTSTSGNVYTILAKVNSYAKATISGGEVSATTGGSYAFAVTAKEGAQITVKGTNTPKISASGATLGTQVARTEGSMGSTIAIEGGLFKATANTAPLYGTISVSGGYFNEYSGTTTYQTNISGRCVSPKRVFNTNPTEKSTYGPEYVYKVVTGYAIAYKKGANGTGTEYTDYKAHGDNITLRGAIFTRTGYTQTGWSTTDGGTKAYNLSASYTANSAATLYPHWTPNSYTIRFLNYNGTVLQSSSVNYGVTPTYSGSTPARAADASYTYTFTGWSPTIAAVSGAQDYTAQFSTTANVASVTPSGGSTSYYTTIGAAFTAANAATADVTITLLANCSSAAVLNFAPTNAVNGTLNLNGKTLTGTCENVITVNKSGKKFTITDTSSGGKVKCEFSNTSALNGVRAQAGTLEVNKGTIIMNNTCTSGTASQARAVYVDGGAAVIITGSASIQASAKQMAYGIRAKGTTGASKTASVTISGGSITASTTANKAYGAWMDSTICTVSGGTITATAGTNTADGLLINYDASSLTVTGGTITATTTTDYGAYGIETQWGSGSGPSLSVSGVTVSATAKTSNAYAFYLSYNRGTTTISSGTFNATTLNSHSAAGVCSHSNHITTISGGTFTVKAGKDLADNADNKKWAWGVLSRRETFNITGGTFNVESGKELAGVYAWVADNADASHTYQATINVSGGTFNVTGKASSAWGAYAYHKGVSNSYAYAGTVNISGSATFNVTAPSSALGLNIAATGTYGNKSASPKANVSGGKFNITGTGAAATSTGASNTNEVIEGGYYTVNGGLSNYVHPTKATSLYRVFTPSGLAGYTYKVARFYTITYNKGSYGGGDAIATGYKAHGDNFTLSSSVYIRTGYTQTAWNTNSAGTGGTSYEIGGTYTTNGDLSIYPTWTVNSHTLSWNFNGGTPSGSYTAAGTVNYGTTITYPTTVSKTGYDFGGWSSSATTMPDNDLTITATLTPHTYSITYKDKGGSAFSGTHETGYPTGHTYNTATTLKSASKTGYTFGGWFTASDCSGTAVASLGATAYTSNITLYAKWTENMSTVSFVASPTGKGTFTVGGATVGSTTAGVTTTRAVTAVPVTGYKFVSWSITGGATISSTSTNPTTVTGSGAGAAATLTGTFTAKQSAVTFDKEGGSGGTNSVTATYGSAMTAVTIPEKTGYNFGGYWDGDNGTGTQYYKTDGKSNRNWDKNTEDATTLYAKWTAKGYTITLNNQSATTAGTASISVTYNASTNLTATPAITVPEKTGYTFGGYYTGTSGSGIQIIAANGNVNASAGSGTYTDASKNWKYDGSITLYAKWTANTTTVTLNKQSGSGGTNSVTATYAAAMPAATMPTRSGYVFGGYYTETNGGGTQYYTNTGASARTWNITAASTTLYAKWTEAEAEVSFNGGTPTPYLTLAQAVNAAKGGDKALIKLLKNVTVTTGLVYDPAANYTCTLDLNGDTIAGTCYTTLKIDRAGATFTITDNSGAKDGMFKTTFDNGGNALRYCVYVNKGNFVLDYGTIRIENNTAYAGSSTGCAVVGVTANETYTVTMNNGALEAEGNYRAHGVYSYGTTKIKGGTIRATVSGSYGTAYGLYSAANTTTVSDSPTIYVTAYKNAYGCMAAGNSPNATTGAYTNGTLTIEGGTFNVSTTTEGGAYGAFATSGVRVVNSVNYGSYGTVNISGGTFNVTSHKATAIGVHVNRGVIMTNTRPNEVSQLYPAVANISGGTFIIKTDETTGTTAAEGVRSYGTTNISGGSFTITANTTDAYGVRVYDGTTTIDDTHSPSFTVRAKTANVFGVTAGETPVAKSGCPNNGVAIVNGGSFDVATSVKTSSTYKTVYGVWAKSGKLQISESTANYDRATFYIGQYASAGTITVNDGSFLVDGHTNIFGIYVTGTSSYSATTLADGDGTVSCPAVSATGEVNIQGGKYKMTGSATVKPYNHSANTAIRTIQGGYYNINTSLASYVVSPYQVVGTTSTDAAAGVDIATYKHKVATAYTLTWNLNGGTVTVAGSGAAKDATGTPSAPWAVGDAITAPTVTKTGYDFSAWSPAVAATMPAENTTYAAGWTAKTYSVTLDREGGTTGATTVTMTYDANTLGGYSNPTKTGYTFGGYYTGDDGTGTQIITAGGAMTTATVSGYTSSGKWIKTTATTLYAKWTPITYSVRFNGNGSTSGSMDNESFTYDVAKALTANAFTKTGYNFAGWATASDGAVVYTNGQSVSNLSSTQGAVVDLYAKWNIVNYTVTYSAPSNGDYTIKVASGTASSASKTANYGQTITLAATPSAGYHFESWTITKTSDGTNVTGSVSLSSSTNKDATFTMPTYGVTVVATFAIDTYAITYAAGTYGSGSLSGGTKTYGVAYTLSNNSSAFTRTGYTYDGWSTNAAGSSKNYNLGGSYPINAAQTFYPHWVVTNYTISYDLAGGSVAVDNPTSYTVESAAITLNNPTKTGYTFAGWTGTDLASATTTVTIAAGSTGNRSYTATWTEKSYTVTFNNGSHGTVKLDGNTISNGGTASVNHFTTKNLAVTASTGYTFAGWTKTGGVVLGNAANASTTIRATSAGTVTATWSANEYSVTLDREGGTTGATSVTMTYNASTLGGYSAPTKTGYTFGGYYTGDDGTGTQIITAGGAMTTATVSGYTSSGKWIKTTATTLYAKWTPITYSVRFNKNDEGATGTMSNQGFTYDAAQTLTANAFTKTGYNFAGWATASDGAAVYTDGQSVSNLSSTQGAVVDLYAKWTAATYDVTLNQNGATTNGSTSVTMTYGSSSHTAITNPKKTDYSFKGWYTSAGGGSRIIQSTGTLQDKTGFVEGGVWVRTTATTLYAAWTQTIKLDKNGGSVDGSAAVRYNSTADLTVTAPTRDGYTVEGYYAEAGCTNKVLTDAGKLVNYSGWVSSGKWIHSGASTLYAKWTEDTHTVTVAAGANGSVDPTSVTAGIATASGTITATPNTGYHFDNWTIPSGVTIASGSTTSASITIKATADDLTITANFTANTYDVALNTNGGTINTGNVTSYTYGVGATLPTDVTRAGYTFMGWFDNDALSGDRIYSISTTATGNKEYWAKWVPAALTFKAKTNSLWSESSNWEPACVPTAEHDVLIQKPCSVDITTAVAKSIVIYNNGSSMTGHLTVGASQALNVTGTITRTTDGSNRLATLSDNILLESAEDAANASLVFSNPKGSTSSQAWVQMYSIAVGSKETGWNWQYIGTPFTGTTASPNYNGSWLYRWKSDCSGWEGVYNANTMDPWVGYCITQPAETTLSMEGTLLPTTESVYLNFPNSNEAGLPDVFANSWTAPIQINQMDPETDFTNVQPTIYLFHTGNDRRDAAERTGYGSSPGEYISVPVETAGTDVIPSKISSMQGFYVKKANSENEAYVTLDYSRHVRPSEGNTIVNEPMYAPKRNKEKPQWMKLITQGSRYGATLYLFAREDLTRGYDAGWDGENINEAGVGPLLYSTREDGTKDAVSAIPTFEGAQVGFQAGEDSEYTFSFTYHGDEVWYLNDLKLGISTRVSAENTYTFLTTDNDEQRFIISATPLAKVHEGIDDAQAAAERPEKMIVKDKLYIKVQTRTYDATGKLVENNK